MKLFMSVVKDKFFNPLTSQSKIANEIVLFKLFDWVYELSEADNDRVLIENRLSDYIETHKNLEYEVFPELEDEDDYLAKAKYIINYLINARWIFEESKGDGLYSINFYDYSYKILNVMRDIRDDIPEQYDRQISNIIRIIKTITHGNFSEILEIEELAINLTTMLKTLRSNIHVIYSAVIDNKTKLELTELVTNFIDYKVELFDKSYYKYKIDDESSGSINKIIIEMTNILDNSVEDYVVNHQHENNKTYAEAEYVVFKTLENIIYKMQDIKVLNKQIDEKNGQYIDTMFNRIYYLTNRNSDIKGMLNKLISNTVDGTIDDFSFINSFTPAHYSWDKLSKPYAKTKKLVTKPIIVQKQIEKEVVQKQMEKYNKSLMYSVDNINKFIDKQFKNKDEIKASKIKFGSKDDYTKFIYAILYANNPKSIYKVIKFEKDYTVSNNLKFKDFSIVRKEDNT